VDAVENAFDQHDLVKVTPTGRIGEIPAHGARIGAGPEDPRRQAHIALQRSTQLREGAWYRQHPAPSQDAHPSPYHRCAQLLWCRTSGLSVAATAFGFQKILVASLCYTHIVETETPPIWNIFDPDCPTRAVLDRIGDRWTVLVVLVLLAGTRRFGELRDQIAGVSPKVLTATLRALERDGLVRRHVYAEVPPRVDYTLTELGRSLETPLRAIRDWAETNMPAIETARALAG
jgi:DNA-binding HxlR family transcriptional regulator